MFQPSLPDKLFTPQGKRSTSIRKILTNETYIGCMAQNLVGCNNTKNPKTGDVDFHQRQM